MKDFNERLEKAEAGDHNLNAEICWGLERDRALSGWWRGAMGMPVPLPEKFSSLPRGMGMASLEVCAPKYTNSLDAAVALAERVLDKPYIWVGMNRGAPLVAAWSCELVTGEDFRSPSIETEASTGPLAICIAILKAKEAEQ